MEDNTPLTLTKLDAAQRQIDTAIELYFHDGDSVSAYSLTFAAMDVLRNLSNAHKVETLLNDFIGYVKPERQKDFLDLIRKPQMFFKHADQNPDETIVYYPRAYELPLLLVCNVYAELTENSTVNMELYDLWYLTQNPDLIQEPFIFKEMLQKGHELAKGLRKRVFFDELKKKPEMAQIKYLRAAAIGNNKRRKAVQESKDEG